MNFVIFRIWTWHRFVSRHVRPLLLLPLLLLILNRVWASGGGGSKSSFTYDVRYDLTPIVVWRQTVWRATLDMRDARNWAPDRDRLPCGRDRVVLPDDYVLLLDHPLDVGELIMPQNGELIIGERGAIRMYAGGPAGNVDGRDKGDYDRNSNNEAVRACPPDHLGTTLRFHPKYDSSWFSPQNWRIQYRAPAPQDFEPIERISFRLHDYWPITNYATFISSASENGEIAIVPHAERIPCTGDWVHFPIDNGSFKVMIERSSEVAKLAAITIGDGNVRYDSAARFDEMLRSFRGGMLFDVRDFNHIDFVRTDNTKPAPGEGCGNDSPRRMGAICDSVRCDGAERGGAGPRARPRGNIESKLKCRDPIIPAGHCCPICASMLVIDTAAGGHSEESMIGPDEEDRRKKKLKNIKIKVLQAMRQIYDRNDRRSSSSTARNDDEADETQQLRYVRIWANWLYDERRFQVIVDPLHDNVAQKSPLVADRYIRALNDALIRNDAEIRQMNIRIESSHDWIEDDQQRLWTAAVVFWCFLAAICVVTYFAYVYYRRTRTDPAFTFVRFRSQGDIELESVSDPVASPPGSPAISASDHHRSWPTTSSTSPSTSPSTSASPWSENLLGSSLSNMAANARQAASNVFHRLRHPSMTLWRSSTTFPFESLPSTRFSAKSTTSGAVSLRTSATTAATVAIESSSSKRSNSLFEIDPIDISTFEHDNDEMVMPTTNPTVVRGEMGSTEAITNDNGGDDDDHGGDDQKLRTESAESGKMLSVADVAATILAKATAGSASTSTSSGNF